LKKKKQTNKQTNKQANKPEKSKILNQLTNLQSTSMNGREQQKFNNKFNRLIFLRFTF